MSDSDHQDQERDPQDEAQPGEELPEGEVELKRASVVTVKHRQDADPTPPDKKIHPRRPLPIVPEKPGGDQQE